VQQQLARLLSRLQQQGLGRRRFRRLGNKPYGRKTFLGVLGLLAAIVAVVTINDRSAPTVPPPPSPASPAIELRTEEASAMVREEGEFFGGLEKVNAALGGSPGESVYLQWGDDPWQEDLQKLKRQVAEFERQSNFISE
jgi:hypothetical protein